MNKVIISVFVVGCIGVALSSPAKPFVPTKNGVPVGEVFWYPNDKGEPVLALLHGKPPSASEPKAIGDDVKFYLYNNHDLGNPVELIPGCANCLGRFIPGAKTAICAHGFSSDHLGGFGDHLRSGFGSLSEDVNVIFVNWGDLATAPWYEWAADNTVAVGQYTAMLIEFLVSNGASLSNIHFIGHSLGAHVGNFITRNMTIGRIGRITALDPALPLFGVKPDEERIDPADADFVDVVHTAMGTLLDGGLSFTEPRGHADFYPNSGAPPQPECDSDLAGSCSHSKAHEYMGLSISNQGRYLACECESWEAFLGGCRTSCPNPTVMGYATPTSARGIFYLSTV